MDTQNSSNTQHDALVYFAVQARDAAPLMARLHDMVLEGRLTLARPETAAPLPPALTDRQREVLALMRQQLSNKQIGRKLTLSHFTVRNHVSQLLRLLNVPTRKAAISALEALDTQDEDHNRLPSA